MLFRSITIHNAKLEALKELVEQANGNPVLIFYQFRHDLIRIIQVLKEYNPQPLNPIPPLTHQHINTLPNYPINTLSHYPINTLSHYPIPPLSHQHINTLSNSTHTIQAWNNGKIPILLAHPASAGHGLNLQYGGNTIIWFSADWSLELYQQANARLHRQGQSMLVNVYHLVTEKTIDEDVIKSLVSKSAGQESLMHTIRARLSNSKLY